MFALIDLTFLLSLSTYKRLFLPFIRCYREGPSTWYITSKGDRLYNRLLTRGYLLPHAEICPHRSWRFDHKAFGSKAKAKAVDKHAITSTAFAISHLSRTCAPRSALVRPAPAEDVIGCGGGTARILLVPLLHRTTLRPLSDDASVPRHVCVRLTHRNSRDFHPWDRSSKPSWSCTAPRRPALRAASPLLGIESHHQSIPAEPPSRPLSFL